MPLQSRRPKIFIVSVLIFSFLLLILDQTLKNLSLGKWNFDLLANHYFGWHPFLNPGIAFSLPVPQTVILILTSPVIFFIGIKAYQAAQAILKQNQTNMLSFAGLVLVFFGACSNFADRVIHRFTVDYLLIFTAVINLADAMIVVGFALYLKTILKNKESSKEEYVSQS